MLFLRVGRLSSCAGPACRTTQPEVIGGCVEPIPTTAWGPASDFARVDVRRRESSGSEGATRPTLAEEDTCS